MSTLITQNARFQSRLTSLDALRALPVPAPLGPRHRPVPHARLVEGFLQEIDRRAFTPVREQYALSASGAALFGVIDLQPTGLAVPGAERGLSFGFRSSTDSALAIKGVAGTRVMVCDNLALSGDLIAFQRKSTTGLDLGDLIATGFDRFLTQGAQLEVHIERLSATVLSDGQAKQAIFDTFNAAIVPVRLFDDVAQFYFQPTEAQTDCQPRSLWGLHNAFTRAMHALSPTRAFSATVALGKQFGLTAARG